ncbi:MAG: methyltransferase domain-containing protein [Rhodospirillales bacterium]|nr:methyltransferase domain-containing protein [Rhodospirillales bacterium]
MRTINYDHTSYDRQSVGSLRAAEAVLKHVFKFIQPKSVCDVGRGIGTWLHASKQLGVETVIGFDGSYVDPAKLLIEREEFQAMDLQASRLSLPDKTDLVVSLEVGEHLDEGRADTFVEDLAGMSDNILFSAALPYRGGEGHINEQFHSYWISKFQHEGFYCFYFVRPLI